MISLTDPAASEWPTVLLDEVAARGSGHTPSKRRPEYWAGPSRIKWVSLADTGRLDKGPIVDTEHSITEVGLAHSAAVLRPAGTVILLRGSSVGKSAVMASEMAVSQDYVTWTCGPKLDPWFLYYILQSRKTEFARVGFGNTIKTIGLDYFKHLVIPLPELSEQCRISQALQDADLLIASLQHRIAKKRAIKQGMMQQLLTGKTRLPGFTERWAHSTIGSLTRVTGGGTPSTRVSAYWGGGVPWFTPAEIKADGSGLVARSERTITQEGLASSAATLLPVGSVLVTSRASIGNCAVAEVPVTTNQGFTSMIPRDHRSTWFLYYWVQQNRSEFESRSAGSTFLEISASKVASIPLQHPNVDEQEAIGQALRDADLELDALRARLSKACAIKVGMMQQLLTGRTRLPVEAAS